MKKQDFSKKILKILSEKTAISMPELERSFPDKEAAIKPKYAISRAFKGLSDAGLIESLPSGQGQYARLTRSGRVKANSLKLESKNSLVNPSWDGKWRIILLDLPESRKKEREALRYLLKKAGFVMLKNSAWISPYPFEHLFGNIKKDLGLATEMMIVVTEYLDTETENILTATFNKSN